MTASSCTTPCASAIGGFLRGANPVRHRGYRRAAWHELRDEVRDAAPGELWRYTADMLYLIENPVVREAFFPSDAQPLAVEPATSRRCSRGQGDRRPTRARRSRGDARPRGGTRRRRRSRSSATATPSSPASSACSRTSTSVERREPARPRRRAVVESPARQPGAEGPARARPAALARLGEGRAAVRRRRRPAGSTSSGRTWRSARRSGASTSSSTTCRRTGPSSRSSASVRSPSSGVDVDGVAYTSVVLDFGPGLGRRLAGRPRRRRARASATTPRPTRPRASSSCAASASR